MHKDVIHVFFVNCICSIKLLAMLVYQRGIVRFPFLIFISFLGIIVWFSTGCSLGKGKPKVLVFTKTSQFRHDCIPDGIKAIQQLGKENGFQVIATEDSSYFTEENLKTFAAVVFLCTTGDVLNFYQQADFERYIEAGGGYVGVHSASDTEYDWVWYGKLVGAYFNGHPDQHYQATLRVQDKNHPATRNLPDAWIRKDEWYNLKKINPDVKVLVNIDESTYQGGTNGKNHPMVWYHEYDGGRAFYTALGHTKESYTEKLFLDHLLGGIQYAMGKDKRDYSQAYVKRLPQENRFVRTVLAESLNEPMEMGILNDGRILFVERRGFINIYEPSTGKVRNITKLDVHSEHEDGLLGIAIDLNFDKNHWIYLFYSPPIEDPVQYVSRFEFNGYGIDLASEKVLLKIPVQRKECCHSAGCLRMDREGNLWISLGDNTNPFASDGYAPIDESADRSPWDAQKSSANTKDLRGKILRIHPQYDGSYTIPEGNLFRDTMQGRPEIYVMGCRNPFRHFYDPRKKFLFWGEVGPDAGNDSLQRGPRGHDEVNQARKAGFFGWPYFVGDNKPYFHYNFSKKVSEYRFDPEHPLNKSPNNSGIQNLPPAQKAFIWYPYAKSDEFPLLGEGGRNAMAGPTYYAADFEGIKNRFPDYFEEKLFIYDWMRGWIFTVQMNKDGDFVKMDPFMQHTKFSRPMDMQFGKDGALYILEYGTQWFAPNPDAKLIRIDYQRGNRQPVARILADKTIGGLPLTVHFSADSSYDFDGDQLQYKWTFSQNDASNKTKNPTFTFKKPGIYLVTLTVKDPSGNTGTASQKIQVGNELPVLNCKLERNQTFYWDNQPIQYQITATDKEDGVIGANRLKISFDYLPQGFDLTNAAQGHQKNPGEGKFAKGKSLMEKSDCKSCHAIDTKVNGPAFVDIARKYKDDDFAARNLSKKIIQGGGGVWGQTAMSAHPQLNNEEATEIVVYILSLADQPSTANKSYPPTGAFTPIAHPERGAYVLMASCTDKGNGAIEPLSSNLTITLRNARIEAENNDYASEGITVLDYNGSKLLNDIKNNSSFGYKNLDLSNISTLTLGVGLVKKHFGGGQMEVRLDSLQGKVIGKTTLIANVESEKLSTIPVSLEATNGVHNIYFVFKSTQPSDKPICVMDWIYFNH